MGLYDNLTLGNVAQAEESREPVNDKASMVVHADGRMEHRVSVQMNAADFAIEGQGVIGTARRPGGAGRVTNRPVQSSDVVTVDGYEMTVGAAVQLGYLEQTDKGFRDRGAPAPEQQAAQQESPSEQQAEPFVDPAADAKAALAESLPGTLADRVLIDYVRTGELDTSLIQESGADVGQVQQQVGQLVGAMVQQQDGALRAVGADAEAFRAWAQKNAKSEYDAAIRQHFYSGTTEPYADLIERYFDTALPSEAAINALGLRTYRNAGGTLMVELPAGRPLRKGGKLSSATTLSVQSAARIGAI